MLRYQQADSQLTLEQGLREYYASREGLVDGRGVSDAASEFFRCHDAAHVVFGCNTELTQEGVVKLWSFFGTTAGFSLLRDYRSPESKEIYETLELAPILRTTLKMILLAPRVIARSRRMAKRWPWHAFEPHLATPLQQLRREYGIEIVAT